MCAYTVQLELPFNYYEMIRTKYCLCLFSRRLVSFSIFYYFHHIYMIFIVCLYDTRQYVISVNVSLIGSRFKLKHLDSSSSRLSYYLYSALNAGKAGNRGNIQNDISSKEHHREYYVNEHEYSCYQKRSHYCLIIA